MLGACQLEIWQYHGFVGENEDVGEGIFERCPVLSHSSTKLLCLQLSIIRRILYEIPSLNNVSTEGAVYGTISQDSFANTQHPPVQTSNSETSDRNAQLLDGLQPPARQSADWLRHTIVSLPGFHRFPSRRRWNIREFCPLTLWNANYTLHVHIYTLNWETSARNFIPISSLGMKLNNIAFDYTLYTYRVHRTAHRTVSTARTNIHSWSTVHTSNANRCSVSRNQQSRILTERSHFYTSALRCTFYQGCRSTRKVGGGWEWLKN